MELIEVLRAELESESARVADVLPGPSFPLRFRRIVAIIPLQESKLNLAYFDYPTPPPLHLHNRLGKLFIAYARGQKEE